MANFMDEIVFLQENGLLGTDSHHLAGSTIYKPEHLALSSLFYLLMCQA